MYVAANESSETARAERLLFDLHCSGSAVLTANSCRLKTLPAGSDRYQQ